MENGNENDELFWRVDVNDRVIGPMPRHQAHSSVKFIHRSVCVLVRNPRGQLLLQKRSAVKDTYPSFWTLSASGHVVFGETNLKAVRREMLEELGFSARLKFVCKLLLCLPQETEYCAVYRAVNCSVKDVVFNQQEISSIIWVDINLLDEFSGRNPITPDALQILRALQYL